MNKRRYPDQSVTPKSQADHGTVFGDYVILQQIGEGGMCRVFEARHSPSGQLCAIKFLREAYREDERIHDFFITEADLSLLLDHPNLIRTYDAGEVDGRYYIAMERIEGGTLADLADRTQEIGFRLPLDFSLYIVHEVLEGLQALHTASGRTGRPLGLVHRDITPHNIFLGFDGRVILGDFGIAHIQAYGDLEPGQTVGKLGYLAPEMAAGDEIDQRADLFAVGVVAYELLTGTRLFDKGGDETLLEATAEAKVLKPRHLTESISRDLEPVVLRALARRPKDRYESAEEMMDALQPHWSRMIGQPHAVAALLNAVFRDQANEWRNRNPGADLLPGHSLTEP